MSGHKYGLLTKCELKIRDINQVLFLRVDVPRQSQGPVLLNPESSALLITMKPSSHLEDNMKFCSQFF